MYIYICKLAFGIKLNINLNSNYLGILIKIGRSSHSEVYCQKYVLRNFAKLIGKHLCPSLFFNKVAGLTPGTLLKKRL